MLFNGKYYYCMYNNNTCTRKYMYTNINLHVSACTLYTLIQCTCVWLKQAINKTMNCFTCQNLKINVRCGPLWSHHCLPSTPTQRTLVTCPQKDKYATVHVLYMAYPTNNYLCCKQTSLELPINVSLTSKIKLECRTAQHTNSTCTKKSHQLQYKTACNIIII